MRYLMGLLLLVFLCVPAQATIVHLGNHSSDDIQAHCGGGTFQSDGDGYSCKTTNCDGKGGHCTVSCDTGGDCYGGTPKITVHVAGLIDASTLDSSLAPPAEFDLNHVSRAQLVGACKSVPGAFFGGDKGNYFCANAHCDPGIGPCYVECDLSKCTAAMPKKPTGKLTLLAILQGGDKVSHQYGPPEPPPANGNGGAVPTKPTKPTAPPPVG